MVNSLNRHAASATTQREVLEQKMTLAKPKAQGNRVSQKLTQVRKKELTAIALNKDLKTL